MARDDIGPAARLALGAQAMRDRREGRQARIGRNEATFRAINERREEELRRLPNALGLLDFTCECGDYACEQTVTLTLAEYEAVRRESRHFAVVPDHAFPEVERVIQGNVRFQVVEKLGVAAEVTDAADDRTPGLEGCRDAGDERRPAA